MRTSIYLPDELAEQVKAHGISISAVTQDALRRAIRKAEEDLASPPNDGARFVAGVLLKGLSSGQVVDLITLLSEAQK